MRHLAEGTVKESEDRVEALEDPLKHVIVELRGDIILVDEAGVTQLVRNSRVADDHSNVVVLLARKDREPALLRVNRVTRCVREIETEADDTLAESDVGALLAARDVIGVEQQSLLLLGLLRPQRGVEHEERLDIRRIDSAHVGIRG